MLHGLDVDNFLRHYWQKKPLLMRGALPAFSGFLSPREVIDLCAFDETPSRFFSQSEGMVPGPFTLDHDDLPEGAWTVLVQSIETVHEGAWTLLDAFAFLPRARLDDVMVSYATAGGGVGPHFDLYDVFLVQASGQRRWRYAAEPVDAALDDQASGPFSFDGDFDEVVGPGDVLYLPPRVPHDGAAVTACTTYSVGVAAPRYSDLVAEFFAFLSGEPEGTGIDLRGVFADENAVRPKTRGALPQALVDDTLARLQTLVLDEHLVRTFLGRLLTGPKPQSADLFAPPDEPIDPNVLTRPGTLHVAPATRVLHDGANTLFINGAAVDISGAPLLRALADQRRLTVPNALAEKARAHLAEFLDAGFLIWRGSEATDNES